MTTVAYFAWQHEVYECEVLSYLWRTDVTPPSWYALVRPSVGQRTWLDQHPKAMQLGLRFGENGSIAVPKSVVRNTRDEAKADISIASLRNWTP